MSYAKNKPASSISNNINNINNINSTTSTAGPSLDDQVMAYMEEATHALPDLQGVDITQYLGNDSSQLLADLEQYPVRSRRARALNTTGGAFEDPNTVLTEHFASPEPTNDEIMMEESWAEELNTLDLSRPPVNVIRGPIPTNNSLGRTPTLFGHMDVGLFNKNTGEPITDVSSGDAGPHTMAHSLVNHALTTAFSSGDWSQLEQIFVTQTGLPEDFRDIIANEKQNPSNKQAAQLERAALRYKELHEQIEDFIDWGYNNPGHPGTNNQFVATAKALRELMDLDPYAVYCWKTGNASRTSLGGKGEPTYLNEYRDGKLEAIAMLVDGFSGKFSDQAAFEAFILRRLELVIDPDEVHLFIEKIPFFKQQYAQKKAAKAKGKKKKW
jgi:hypothetical protein